VKLAEEVNSDFSGFDSFTAVDRDGGIDFVVM